MKTERENNPKKKWIPLCERESISPLWIFAICANQIAINFVWAPLNVLTLPMCTKLGFSNKSSSLVMLMGSISGLIIPPFFSAISDSTTLKMGRRRIYLIVGEIIVIIGLLMISFCREISKYFNPLSFLIAKPKEGEVLDPNSEATIYFIFGEIFALVGGNMASIPGMAMVSDVVPSSQKVLASSICSLDYAISASISNAIGAFKLYQYTNFTNESFVLFVSCIIGIIAMTVSVISTPEERLTVKPKSANPITVLSNSVRSIDDDMLFIIFAVLFYNFGSSQFYAQGSNYIAKYIFGGIPNAPDGIYDEGISYFQFLMLVLTLSQFFFSTINTKVINRIGFKMAWFLGCLAQATSNILLFLIPTKEFLFIPYIIAGFASCIAGSVPNAYVSLNAPSERAGECFTLLVLTFNVSGIVTNILLQMYLGSFSFFQANSGRLVACVSIFFIFSMHFARTGFGYNKQQKGKED